jgi:hypothetical protein
MSLKHLATATLITFAAAAAQAVGRPPTELPRDADLRAYLPAPRSRAEVLADLEVYHRSGLAELDHKESPNAFGSAYLAA